MALSRSLLLRFVLVFALLGGQMAGWAHGLGHVAEQAKAAQGQERQDKQENKSVVHVCLECLALSALDVPLAAGQVPLPLVAASLLPAAEPLPLGLRRHHSHAPIRGPPVSL